MGPGSVADPMEIILESERESQRRTAEFVKRAISLDLEVHRKDGGTDSFRIAYEGESYAARIYNPKKESRSRRFWNFISGTDTKWDSYIRLDTEDLREAYDLLVEKLKQAEEYDQ